MQNFLLSGHLNVYPVVFEHDDLVADLVELEQKHTRMLKQLKVPLLLRQTVLHSHDIFSVPKMTVLYARPGQTDIRDIWANAPPESSGFYRFLDSIGQKIDLRSWSGYRGNAFILLHGGD